MLKTDVRVYHGDQIGGCVTVIKHEDGDTVHRIMIDYGASLPGHDIDEEFDYPWDEEPVDAVFFTHYHGDHIGRFDEIPENIPLYMGAVAREIMQNTCRALCGCRDCPDSCKKELEILLDDGRIHEVKEGIPIADIPGFTVTAYSVDHSAYEAYMYLIEILDDKESKVILHTGDYRGHGFRGKDGKTMLNVIDRYIHNGGRKVDILITEGTMMSRKCEKVMTEDDLRKEAEKVLSEYKYAYLICSSTNFDSLTAFYQAARKNKKFMYTHNSYYYQQLQTFSKHAGKYTPLYDLEKIYEVEFDKNLKSRYWKESKRQDEVMRERGFLMAIKAEDYCQGFIDHFIDEKDKMVIIYSMWDGYLDKTRDAYKSSWGEFIEKQENNGIKVVHLHTSGHATAKLIGQVIEAVDPQEAIIPIHTENRDGFMELDIREDLKMKIKRF